MDKYEYWWMSVHNEFLPADISHEMFTYEEIYKMGKSRLQNSLYLTDSQALYVSSSKNYDIDIRYAEFMASGVNSVTCREENYPERLMYIDDKPYALFYLGNLPDENEKNVAMIGSRACSEYGRIMAKRLATDLASCGIGVISGMALGIDGIAQMHALNAGAKSYGILGGSVTQCYPRANKALYERLINTGAVISEYANGVPAKAAFFPKRNRIISGLSDGVIVIQAKLRSGTFITVDSALSQGKDVMVVPGMVTDPLSVGCNLLIMQGAFPVQCAEDVIHIMKDHPRKEGRTPLKPLSLPPSLLSDEHESDMKKASLTKEEGIVYDALGYSMTSPEQLAGELNADIYDILKPLITLEMKGLIKECGKNLYVKCS